MTPYGTKTTELADLYRVARTNDYVMRIKDELRQHLEQGEPDCRLCKQFRAPDHCMAQIASYECKNFDLFERAEYTPLCEVTK